MKALGGIPDFDDTPVLDALEAQCLECEGTGTIFFKAHPEEGFERCEACGGTGKAKRGPALPRCSGPECDHGLTCLCDPREYIRFLKAEEVKLREINSELVEVLKSSVSSLGHAIKFFKYQRPGREFSPNREDAEADLQRLRTLILKAEGGSL